MDKLCVCNKVIEDENITGNQCKKCYDEEVMIERQASEEWNWRNDHGDFN